MSLAIITQHVLVYNLALVSSESMHYISYRVQL